MSSKKETAVPKVSFEQGLARLDEILNRLERGDVPLEESMKLYEEGAALASGCDKALREAEQKVLKLAKTQEGAVEAIHMEVNDLEA